MKRIVEFRPEARLEFEEAAEWYDLQQPGTGKRFIETVDKTLAHICEMPQAFPVIHGTTVRRAAILHFPFVILFTDEGLFILIRAIFHTSRNPIVWRGRID